MLCTVCCSRAKTVNENLKMNAALLSRFDLVFILLDKPDELLDKRVSDHIIAVSSCPIMFLVHNFITHNSYYGYVTCSISEMGSIIYENIFFVLLEIFFSEY